MSRPSTAAWIKPLALAALLGLGLALLLRWPLSVFPDALPHDPNSALHTLAAADLAAHGDPSRLYALDFPDGAPVRRVAWPLLLLALPFQAVLAPIPALNLALVLLLAAQVLGVMALARTEGAAPSRALALGLGAALAPTTVLFLGNGQPENVVFLPILVAGWGAMRGGTRGLLLCAAGLSLAAWSSPYQGVVAGVFALAGASTRGGRALVPVLLVSALCALPVGLYFGSQAADAPGEELGRTRPADADRPAPATLTALVTPAPGLDGGLGAPGWANPDRRWPQLPPATGAYLGLVLLIGGTVGLWRGRRDPQLRAAMAGGAACLVLALGASLRLSPTTDTGLPLPWRGLALLPGLNQMGATMRFLTGVELALALGLAALVGRRKGLLGLVALALLVDALLLSPGRWPIAGSKPRAAALVAALPPGPVLLWPGTPLLSTHQHAILALALDRPVASFNGPVPEDTAVAPGARPPMPSQNSRGEAAADWAARLQAAGVRGLVEITPLPAAHRQPLTQGAGEAVGELRVYRLP